MSRVHDCCRFRSPSRPRFDSPVTPEQRPQYCKWCAEFPTLAIDTLYKRFIRTLTFSNTEVDAAKSPPCLLCVHALGRRYDPERATETRAATRRR
jgi:hypothetical protein